jgi:fatty acid desaturase
LKWRDISAAVGIATMWMTPNPLTVAALSTWTYASWTMVAHHTCHGGYNRVDAGKFNSRGFALGNVVKRVQDWCDWMAPEAWNVEHNRLHHYHLGEDKDPDLVQRNLEFLRDSQEPMYQKYATVLALMPIWKWAYYAPNTYKELQIQKFKRNEIDLPKDFEPTKAATVSHILLPKDAAERATQQVVKPMDFFANVLGPFLFSRFILLPLPLLAVPGVGQSLFFHAIINLVLADLLTNLHGFITIVTNHCGDDIYTFDDQVKPKSGSFYVRQIVGSANYKTGDDITDFAHGWLNYQIEHHVWPDLSMLQYQRGAPQLKAICEKYGVPYVQESVWTRLFKTIDVMVGNSSMKRFPTELEPASDKAGKSGVTWKSTNGAIDE